MKEPQPNAREVVLLREQQCPLCEHALDSLEELSGELGFSLRQVDISEAGQELRERYRYAVPVVCASGLTLLSGRIDTDSLRVEIRRAFGPDPLAGVPPEEAEFLPALECPICEGDLESRPRAVACLRCGKEYSRLDGVLILMEVPERSTGPNLMDWVGRLIGFKLPREREKGR